MSAARPFSTARFVYRHLMREALRQARNPQPFIVQRPVDATRWGKFSSGGVQACPRAERVLAGMLPKSIATLPVAWPDKAVLGAGELQGLIRSLFRKAIERVSEAHAGQAGRRHSDMQAEYEDAAFAGVRAFSAMQLLQGSTSVSESNGVQIITTSKFVEKDSQGEDVYAYRVHVQNDSDTSVQLVGRHWVFEDAHGHRFEVQKFAQGFVGQQPRLRGGQWFEYVSGVKLRSSPGTMHGAMLVVDEKGADFEAEINPVALNAQEASE